MNNIKRIQQALKEKNMEAIMLTGDYNRFYAAGFSSSAGVWLISRDQAAFFVDSRYIEAAEQQITGATICQTRAGSSYTQLINRFLGEWGVQSLGFEEEVMSYAQYSRMTAEIPVAFVPAQAVMSELRGVKSPEEAEKMRAAQAIAEAAFMDILPKISTELTERDVARELEYAMLCHGADSKSFDSIVVSAEKSSMPHGEPGDVRIKPGFLTIDFGCMKDGYCSDTTRTVCVGKATEEMRRVYDIVLQAQLASIAVAKAGVPGCDIDKAARDVITEAGYGDYFGHGLGHGVGLEIHEEPNANIAWKAPLPAGAFISAEPGIYLPGRFGVRIEDVLHLTENGNENITKLPKELIEL